MEDKIINGRVIASKLTERLKLTIANLKVTPKIVSILIGNDPPSVLYTSIKQKKAQSLGIDFQPIHLPETTPYLKVEQLIHQLNQDPQVNGIMLQLPLPKVFLNGRKTQQLLDQINPQKDVDGLTTHSPFLTAAVLATLTILQEEGIEIRDKNIAVVGASDLIGKPLAAELIKLGGKVSIYDRKTQDLRSALQTADIICSATGSPHLITGDMVKQGVVIIDIGVMIVDEPDTKQDEKVVGDVDFDSVIEKVSKITPVPGGVGPVTIISLMENTVKSLQSSLTLDRTPTRFS